MADKNKLDAILKQRNPLEEREIIKPVDVLSPTQEPNASSVRDNRTPAPNERTERVNRTSARKKRTPVPRERTTRANEQDERVNRTVLDELYTPGEETKRKTERYSFEIYTDQKGSIEKLRYLYHMKTGKKLSVSRIIREALEEYLDKTLSAFADENEEGSY